VLLYLDNSVLNRPFDDPDIGTNKLEAEVLSLIVKLAQKNKVKIVNSSVIEYENSLNKNPERKKFVMEILKEAKHHQNIDESIRKQAEIFNKKMNIASIDALHLAAAEKANVDVFISCDYDIIKQYKGKVKVINPMEFIQYYEHSNK